MFDADSQCVIRCELSQEEAFNNWNSHWNSRYPSGGRLEVLYSCYYVTEQTTKTKFLCDSATLVSSLMLGVGIGALAQPQLAVRFMTVKSTRELNRAICVGAVFILFTAGTAYVVGALSNVYFYKLNSQIAIAAAKGNPDLIVPLFINHAMPKFFVYIFTLTLLSAAMSTLSSLFHVTGSALGHDLYCNIFRKEKDNLAVSRVGIIIGIILSIVLAFYLPAGIVARGTAIFFGVCAAAFMPAYFAAVYWKRATTAGVCRTPAFG